MKDDLGFNIGCNDRIGKNFANFLGDAQWVDTNTLSSGFICNLPKVCSFAVGPLNGQQ